MIRRVDPRAQTLARMGVLAGATSRQLNNACRLMTEVRIPAGSVLCTQGQEALEVFLIVDGDVAVSHDSAAVGTVGAGGIIGELGVLDGKPRSATAVALTDLVTLVMSTAEFSQLLAQVPAAAKNLKDLRITRTEELVALSLAA